ncbi:hypothetical protein EYF80_005794 [Liparis tanakae]|uniref:Uncharacterized protein n=1 Tax=Liparis tanakae TaxID=230148 RepID=A0A4Z2J351_9TELE|nr:hypothetical protein EYF80_005794 [Liparis tanakae]
MTVIALKTPCGDDKKPNPLDLSSLHALDSVVYEKLLRLYAKPLGLSLGWKAEGPHGRSVTALVMSAVDRVPLLCEAFGEGSWRRRPASVQPISRVSNGVNPGCSNTLLLKDPCHPCRAEFRFSSGQGRRGTGLKGTAQIHETPRVRIQDPDEVRWRRFAQVGPQANQQHFSQSALLNDVTGIMIGDEVQRRSCSSTPSFAGFAEMME